MLRTRPNAQPRETYMIFVQVWVWWGERGRTAMIAELVVMVQGEMDVVVSGW